MKSKAIFRVDTHLLTIDQVLIEYIYPVFFTCLDEMNRLYIVACYSADSEKTGWIISSISPNEVIAILENASTLRDAFKDKKIWNVIGYKNEHKQDVYVKTYADIDKSILPTEGEYMDAEPDEFSEEIAIMKKRIDSEDVEEIFETRIQYAQFEYEEIEELPEKRVIDNSDFENVMLRRKLSFCSFLIKDILFSSIDSISQEEYSYRTKLSWRKEGVAYA